MIDLHCHILPEVDDGATDIAVSLAMARMAVADGISAIACTPHINPGIYSNSGPAIVDAVDRLSMALRDAGIPLHLVVGADVHLAPDLISAIRTGQVPTIAGSRYFLLEPPHHVVPPRLEDAAFQLLTAGYVPILTHPERLSWIERNFDVIRRLGAAGVWMQITAGSLTGRFGRRARYWSERMLDEGAVQIVATDAHNCDDRPPLLAAARALIAERSGETEAEWMTRIRPLGVVKNLSASEIEAVGSLETLAIDK